MGAPGTSNRESPSMSGGGVEPRLNRENSLFAQFCYSVVAAKSAIILWRTNLRDRVLKRWEQYRMAKDLIENKGMEGNIWYYTPENLRKREHLRHDADIQALIEEWWRHVADLKNGVSRACYFEMYNRLAYHLLPSISSKRKAQVFAEDWKRDVGASHTIMTYPQFADSIFHLADTWVDSIESKQYVKWLKSFLPKIRDIAHGHASRLKTTGQSLLRKLEMENDPTEYATETDESATQLHLNEHGNTGSFFRSEEEEFKIQKKAAY
eukprot:gb/GECG01012862.1/.p1 GENE.gb/GECG01012862.1/~~gb/GECG01012862.1/.p1  ORF type:complete len:266 (+),score=36.88 gb/GECG01012862.1/:1-798(+)